MYNSHTLFQMSSVLLIYKSENFLIKNYSPNFLYINQCLSAYNNILHIASLRFGAKGIFQFNHEKSCFIVGLIQ